MVGAGLPLRDHARRSTRRSARTRRTRPTRRSSTSRRTSYYRWCTYLFLPLQYASLIGACALWASGDLSLLESLGLAFTVGIVTGIAINTAHELGHKRKNGERWLSKVALAQTGYGHFFIEHNRGHHVRVATPEDPASSRLGESFWAFLPRTVVGQPDVGVGAREGAPRPRRRAASSASRTTSSTRG